MTRTMTKTITRWWRSLVERHRAGARLRRINAIEADADRRIYIKDAVDGSIYLWVDDVPVLQLANSAGVKLLANGNKVEGLKMLMYKARLQYRNLRAMEEGIAENTFKQAMNNE